MLPFRAAPRRGPHLLMGRLMAVQAFWQSQNLGAGRIHSAQADEIGSPGHALRARAELHPRTVGNADF